MGRFSQDRIRSIAAHGAEKHTNITRELFIPVIGGTASSVGNFWALNCADGADVLVRGNFKVPVDFVSFTKLECLWASSAASGNMYWEMDAQYGAAGQDFNTHSDDTAVGVTATGGAWKLNVQESPTALTLSSLALNDYVGIAFQRTGTHANDTLGAAVGVMGFLFTYVASQ